ncbi:MAG: ABC transporter substrate-binding protein, partial [Candidatus Sericytochromatia bacterium]
APTVPAIEVRFVPQEQTALQLWRSGAVDVVQGAPPTQYDLFQREAPDQLHLTPSGAWEHLAFNLEHPILKDVRVRRAIAHLIDRHQLNTKAYGGVQLPAWSELPTTHWAYPRGVEKRYVPDPEAVARLLDEAGWKPGPDGMRRRGSEELALSLLTTSEKPSRSLAAQIFQRQWREAGIALTIEKQPASLVFGSAESGGRMASGDFALALVSSFSRPDPDATFRWRSDQVPPHGQNRSRYRNAKVDGWLEAGQRTLDRAERKRIYGRIAERLITDLPVLPLLYWVDVDATRPRLSGFKPNPTLRGNLWNVWEWKLVNPS